MLKRLLISLLFATSAAVPAQTSITLPDDLGQKLDEIFKTWDREDGPGGVVAVMVGEEVKFQKAFGLANVEHAVPNTVETRFDIGSISKQFTAMCILLLEEEGLLSLDDFASNHLEGYQILDDNPITIRNLLTHTSGIRDFFALLSLSQITHWTDARVFDLVKRQQTLNFETNTRYMYTNTAYLMLGEIVKIVSKQTLAEFAEERIFEPLGMEHSTFKDQVSLVIPNFADSYRALGDSWQRAHSPNTADGAGGLTTTIEDMSKWIANYRHNVLGKGDQSLVERMQEMHMLKDGSDAGYGLGLAIGSLAGVRTIDHSGGWEGYRSRVTMFPDHELTVIVFGNEGTSTPITYSTLLARHILADHLNTPEEKPDAIELDEQILEEYVGTYQLDEERVAVVTLRNENLFVQITGQSRNPVFPIAKDKFYFQNAFVEIDFSRDESDKVVEATILQGDMVREMPRIEPFVATEEYLNEIVGRYESPELDSYMILSIRPGRLLMEVPSLGRRVLPIHLRDHCQVGNLKLGIHRDEEGNVNEVRLSLSRAIEMRYIRVEEPSGPS